jgi:hypothetical protein
VQGLGVCALGCGKNHAVVAVDVRGYFNRALLTSSA